MIGKASTNISVRRQMVRGSAWMIAARWGIRLVGLLSTIVLARLLAPADFGLVAMGMLVVNFTMVFGQAGQTLAVIRTPDATRDHFDTAWTMSIVIGVIVATSLVCVAPLASWY